MVSLSTTPPGCSSRSTGPARRQRASQRLILVHEPGQPVCPLDRLVDAEHVSHRSRPGPAGEIRLPESSLGHAERTTGDIETGFGGSKPEADRGGGEIDQVLAEVHRLSVWVQLPATRQVTWESTMRLTGS